MEGACGRTGNQPGRQPRAPAQPVFQRPHVALVPLVIVAQKVQKAMQGQNSQFRGSNRGPRPVPAGPATAERDGEIS